MKLSHIVSATGFVVASATASAQVSTRVTDNSTAILTKEDCALVTQEAKKSPNDPNIQSLLSMCNDQSSKGNLKNPIIGGNNSNSVDPHAPRQNYPSNWQIEQEVIINGVPVPSSQLPTGVNANKIIINR